MRFVTTVLVRIQMYVNAIRNISYHLKAIYVWFKQIILNKTGFGRGERREGRKEGGIRVMYQFPSSMFTSYKAIPSFGSTPPTSTLPHLEAHIAAWGLSHCVLGISLCKDDGPWLF